MEHNSEKSLAQKIQAAEKVRVLWNKDRVWQEVSHNVSPQKRGWRTYLLWAASVSVLAVIISLALRFTPAREEKVLLKPLPSPVSPGEKQQDVHLAERATPEKRERALNLKPTKKNKISNVPVQAEAAEDMLPIAEIDVNLIIAEPEPTVDAHSSAKISGGDSRKIEPVVGVIAESRDPLAEKSKIPRRLRRYETKDTEPAPFGTSVGTILIAGKKQNSSSYTSN